MRLSRPPEAVWTGVVISEDGEILTTSGSLGEAPVVDVRFWDGREGQACVTGRDDDIGLALLEPLIQPAQSYVYLAFSSESPSVGQRVQVLQYSSFSPALDRRATDVVENRSQENGYTYVRIDVPDNTTADGAVLLNESGTMQGMRMPALWLLQHQVANPGEVAAVDAPAIADLALSALRSGRMHVLPGPSRTGMDTDIVPRLPVVFNGELTVDGAPAPVGALLHAKVSREGHPDLWQSTSIGTAGEYVLPVSADSQTYLGGSVEFWMDCRRSPTTAVYETPPSLAVELDLAFQLQ